MSRFPQLPYFLAPTLAWCAACSFAWDDLDPRVSGAASTTTAGGGAATGGGEGGAGGIGAAGGGGIGGVGGTGGTGPWLEGYARRRLLTIGTDTEAADLVDVPILLVLDDTRIDHGITSGRDLRIVSHDHEEMLAHEVEHWNAAANSYVWFRLPELSAPGNSARRVWLYYGNDEASSATDSAATFSNGYLAVWHLGEELGDATNGNDATASGTTLAPGRIGQARLFDGVDDYLDVADPSDLDGMFAGGGTITAWIRPLGTGGGNFGRIVDRTTTTGVTAGWSLTMITESVTDSLSFSRSFSNQYGAWAPPANSIPRDDMWIHLAIVYDEEGTDMADIYLDGVKQTVTQEDTPAGTLSDESATPVRIGNHATTTGRAFDGTIDELRLANVPRSAAWIAVQHASMTDALVDYGDEEAAP